MQFSTFKTAGKLATVAALSLGGFSAYAQSVTGNLNVNANVVAACSIDTVAPLNFGNYIQGTSVGATLDVNTTIDVTCGNGVLYNVRLDGSNNSSVTGRSMFQGTNELRYQLYRDVSRLPAFAWGVTDGVDTFEGLGTGAVASIPVYGRLAKNAFNDAAATGAYTSVVTVTVAY
jgi:spore coat protein U-like protein